MNDMFSPLTLPNGSQFPNRLCKAAMEENMCDAGQIPGPRLFNLYRKWAEGGAGLILSGNVMITPDALTGPGGIVLTKETLGDEHAAARFKQWAKIGTSGAGQFWLQLNHPGRQVFAAQDTALVSASATQVSLGVDGLFTRARALEGDEIKALVTRFAETAEAAQALGFDGVQIHAAHGYLLSQFLSPLTNLRTDEWGGSLENRARFLLAVIDAVRARVGPSFGLGVKLNSADFQKGGFDKDDAAQVVTWMNGRGVDIAELSGGSYESPAMMGRPAYDTRSESTKARELYFLDFAQEIAQAANMPIMVTGGVTKKSTAADALEDGKIDLIGIARAMAYAPDLPNLWRAGAREHVTWRAAKFKKNILNSIGNMALTKNSLHLMGADKPPALTASPLIVLIKDRLRIKRLTKRYKTWLAKQSL
jgi:2,4-dienoyl-CoA reductase-like NADH-dependent reductase (Old Yellow Enzyme family)